MAVRILVVDDATFIRDLVKRQLREKIPGVEIFDAPDGNRAVALLKKQAVHLILSDWEMPGMTGEELLQWVRSSEAHSKTPFIMISSRGDRDYVVKAVKAGVSDYLSKPFTGEELLTKTMKQLRRAGIDVDKLHKRVGTTQGITASSIEALTGGAAKPIEKKAPAIQAAGGVFATKPVAKATDGAVEVTKGPAEVTKGDKDSARSRAQLRFANVTCPCVVKDISLQAIQGLIQRSQTLPTVFDQAVVDIETSDGQAVARVNGYVHSIQAADNRVDTNVIKIVIRFVDNDPEKFEALSRYIAG